MTTTTEHDFIVWHFFLLIAFVCVLFLGRVKVATEGLTVT